MFDKIKEDFKSVIAKELHEIEINKALSHVEDSLKDKLFNSTRRIINE